MLDRIHIENYKCLRDVTVELGDFTILIGPNDSGKSSFLDVIKTFGKTATQGYSNLFANDRSLANLVWRKDPDRAIVWEVQGRTAEQSFVYHLELPVDQKPPREELTLNGKKEFWTEDNSAEGDTPPPFVNVPSGIPVIVVPTGKGRQVLPAQYGITHIQKGVGTGRSPYWAIADTLTSSIEYRFEMSKLPLASIPQPGITLDPTGANLAAVLDVMQNSADRSAFESIQKALHEAIPSLNGIVLPPASKSGAKALEFILSGNGQPPVTIPGSLASGGALLLTAFLTLAYTDTPGLLLFEEPENGLHPQRLQMVIDILRKISRGEVGNRKRQVLITTHNPLLLNYARPEDVRVFVRDPQKGTRIFPMSEVRDIDRLLKEFALGELWYLLGEEKLLQEQPA